MILSTLSLPFFAVAVLAAPVAGNAKQPAIAAVSPVPSAGSFVHSLCAIEPFYNGIQERTLHGASLISSSLTVEECASYCSSFQYFGVEYGKECYCGDRIENGTALDLTGGCNNLCPGAPAEFCGGSGRMNLYQQSTMTSVPSLPTAFPVATIPSVNVTGWKYVSCVLEPFMRRNLSGRALDGVGTSSASMTVEQCASYCEGYTYFGVEYSQECYCGNSLASDISIDLYPCGCDMGCTGNDRETCGGSGRLSLYQSTKNTTGVLPSISTATGITCAASTPALPAQTASSVVKDALKRSPTRSAFISLITAGTFETNTWANWFVNYQSTGSSYSVQSPGYIGDYFGQTWATESGYMWLEYPAITVTPGMLYTFSMYYNNEAPDSCATRLENDEGTFLWLGYEGTSITSGQWAHYSVSFISSDATERLYLLHSCSSSSSGAAQFDNIQLVPSGSKIYKKNSPATGANLVTLPNFGSGNLNAYTVDLSSASATVVKPGWNGNTYSVKVNLTNSGYQQACGYISQVVPTIKNKVYRVTLAYMYKTALEADCEIAVVLQVNNTYQQASQVTTSTGTAAGAWALAQGVITSVNGSDELLIQAVCNGGKSQIFHFGDIQVVPLN